MKKQIKIKIIPKQDLVAKFIQKNKFGQMKIQQMAFMLIAVFIFFALVGLIIVAVGFSGLKEKATALQEENAKLLVSRLADSPEFSCGGAFGETRTNCIDLDKTLILKNKISRYKNFWKISGIEIIKIYPAGSQLKECTAENYPDCGKITLIDGQGIAQENFVALCRKEYDTENYANYDKCELGKILVKYEKIQ